MHWIGSISRVKDSLLPSPWFHSNWVHSDPPCASIVGAEARDDARLGCTVKPTKNIRRGRIHSTPLRAGADRHEYRFASTHLPDRNIVQLQEAWPMMSFWLTVDFPGAIRGFPASPWARNRVVLCSGPRKGYARTPPRLWKRRMSNPDRHYPARYPPPNIHPGAEVKARSSAPEHRRTVAGSSIDTTV